MVSSSCRDPTATNRFVTEVAPSPSRRDEIRSGLIDTLPLLLAVIPFGFVVGVAAVGAGLSTPLSIAASGIIFAGAAQLATMSLVGAGAAWPTIIGTALVINARHVMYSGTLVRPLGHLPRAWRWLVSYLMIDQVFALTVTRSRDENDHPDLHWYSVGIGLTLWIVWMIATSVGVIVGASVPGSWGLGFAAPLIFIGLIFPALIDRASVAAAVASGITAILAVPLPFNLGLLVAALVGITTGVAVDRTR